jgi:hypothetical protein
MDPELTARIISLEENVASMTGKLDIALEALATFTQIKTPIINESAASEETNDDDGGDNLSPLGSPNAGAVKMNIAKSFNSTSSSSLSSNKSSFSEYGNPNPNPQQLLSEKAKRHSIFTPPQSTWVKLYSDKKVKYFFFNPVTKKVCTYRYSKNTPSPSIHVSMFQKCFACVSKQWRHYLKLTYFFVRLFSISSDAICAMFTHICIVTYIIIHI